MDKKQLAATVKQICDEKNISIESVIETIEAALAAAYRKDFGTKLQNIKVDFDLETGESQIFDIKTVVEDVPPELLDENGFLIVPEGEEGAEEQPEESEEDDDALRYNPKTDLQITEAKKLDKKYELGDVIKTALEIPEDYGRMAAQTAKQVIIQKLREAERQVQFEDFKGREGEMLTGTVQRREGYRVLVDLGNVTALLPQEEQVRGERYNIGDRIRVLLFSVEQTTKGPSIIVSRAHADVLRSLFEMEIPEIASGVVEIKAIAREPGSRSKVAVYTEDESIDPIGSCVGQRGARIQTIINELGGEKVDIIEWDEDIEKFLAQAISPAKADTIDINEEEKSAVIHVVSDQLSLAIGKAGQNVRLAVKLTGWDINIQEVGGSTTTTDENAETKEGESSTEAQDESLNEDAADASTEDVSSEENVEEEK